VLHKLQPPDVSFSPASPDIGFVHRRTEWAEIYFLANTGNRRQGGRASFRVGDLHPGWWDPSSGETCAAAVLAHSRQTTTLAVWLEPYGSRILVFSPQPTSKPCAAATSLAPNLPTPVDLGRGWKVTFLKMDHDGSEEGSQPNLSESANPPGQSVLMAHLRSWTDDERTRFFSGEAVYEKSFIVPASLAVSLPDLWLDLGEGRALRPTPQHSEGMQAWFEGPVREAAVVYVNGQRAGTVWHPPYVVKLGGLVRLGENNLRIIVANTAINEMAAVALPDYRLLNIRYGERFTPQDMGRVQPVPSGLLEEPRLVARPPQSVLQQ
jgi:alpha-L-rhamnosidase